MTVNTNTTLAQIERDLTAYGYSPESAAERMARSQSVVVDDDCCLVLRRDGADFYFRYPFSTPRWGYVHSYRTPRRPSDVGRYLRHGRKAMQQWGWCLDGADV